MSAQWPYPVGKPDDPIANVLRYRAQSILHGFVDDPLPDTREEAEDVIAWYDSTRGTVS